MVRAPNKCLAILADLERYHRMVERFSAFKSSSWVSLKNVIFERSLDHLAFSKTDRNGYFSWAGVHLLVTSICHYLINVFSFKPKDLFVGAGSGLIFYKGDLLDSFFPGELSSTPGQPVEDTIYLMSANHVANMWAQRDYLRQHRVIIYSLFVSPLRMVFGRISAFFLPLNRRLASAAHETSALLADISVNISPQEILGLHARFCAGYLIYRLLLLPLRIRRAFVVSAYSNSELCAVLRRMGVEIVEVQHGLIGPTHRGYNYAIHSQLLPVPDKVYVYNKFWRDELLSARFFSFENIVISERVKYSLALSENNIFKFNYILFTGQGVCFDDIISFLQDFFNNNSSVVVVYAPHPSETEEYISKIKKKFPNDKRFYVSQSSEVLTERLIADCVAHVSIYSSCHFDAVHFKGKTFILDVLKDNIMDYYADKYPGTYVRISNANQIIDVIR